MDTINPVKNYARLLPITVLEERESFSIEAICRRVVEIGRRRKKKKVYVEPELERCLFNMDGNICPTPIPLVPSCSPLHKAVFHLFRWAYSLRGGWEDGTGHLVRWRSGHQADAVTVAQLRQQL